MLPYQTTVLAQHTHHNLYCLSSRQHGLLIPRLQQLLESFLEYCNTWTALNIDVLFLISCNPTTATTSWPQIEELQIDNKTDKTIHSYKGKSSLSAGRASMLYRVESNTTDVSVIAYYEITVKQIKKMKKHILCVCCFWCFSVSLDGRNNKLHRLKVSNVCKCDVTAV